jgi:hypothetical protein
MNNNVGESTPGKRLKSLHSAKAQGTSLKEFARQCLKSEDAEVQALAKQWFKNKSASGQTQRTAANANLAKTIGAAVKQSRRAASSKK